MNYSPEIRFAVAPLGIPQRHALHALHHPRFSLGRTQQCVCALPLGAAWWTEHSPYDWKVNRARSDADSYRRAAGAARAHHDPDGNCHPGHCNSTVPLCVCVCVDGWVLGKGHDADGGVVVYYL
jgi:hypothetical protein